MFSSDMKSLRVGHPMRRYTGQFLVIHVNTICNVNKNKNSQNCLCTPLQLNPQSYYFMNNCFVFTCKRVMNYETTNVTQKLTLYKTFRLWMEWETSERAITICTMNIFIIISFNYLYRSFEWSSCGGERFRRYIRL